MSGSPSIPTASLVRLDDMLWSYRVAAERGQARTLDEIRLQIPAFENQESAYKLATCVQALFKEKKITTKEALFKQLTFEVRNGEHAVNRRWKIVVQNEEKKLINQALQELPFAYSIYNKKIAVVRIEPFHFSWIAHMIRAVMSVWQTFKAAHSFCFASMQLQTWSLPYSQRSLQERLKEGVFTDPFTELATSAFQSLESHFVFEKKITGDYCFRLAENGFLTLVPNSNEMEENKKACRAYKQFALQEYGEELVNYLEYAYEFSFDELILRGLPLLPDHIFRTNIGVNNIQLNHIEELYDKLFSLFQRLEKMDPQVDLNDIFDFQAMGKKGNFSIRELRGLIDQVGLSQNGRVSKLCAKELLEFLKSFFGKVAPESVKNLPPAQFNTLVAMIMPQDFERERALTGRKIRHLAIAGCYTMGDQNCQNPVRDFFELLHIFPGLQKTEDWKNFYELAAHVVSKKSIFRAHPAQEGKGKQELRVGLLIPGPKTATGESRWFYNEAFFDDNNGNLNYVLLPACSGYSYENKALPFVKVFRSTASSIGALDWEESVMADLNPIASPGPADMGEGLRNERVGFDERTIPLWVAYLLFADSYEQKMSHQNQLATSQRKIYEKKKEKCLRQALSEFMECYGSDSQKYAAAKRVGASKEPLAIFDFLTNQAALLKELPKYKINQDMVFAGHSLGATLSQLGTYFFGPKRKRIPLPGYSFTCFSSEATGIDNGYDERFMSFGREHKGLFKALKVHWKLIERIEYGDIIVESGQTYLGTTGYKETDADWLQIEADVFRPLKSAEDLAITTFVAHGRRFGLAREGEGKDYTITKLEPQMLYSYKHSVWLSKKFEEIFGYGGLGNSYLIEGARRGISFVISPLTFLINYLYKTIFRDPIANEDKSGCIFARYVRKGIA